MNNSNHTVRNAAVGAVVTLVLSFTAVSPLLGGGVAGYLQREPPRRGARVGAISGAIASVPFFLVVVLGAALFLGSASAGVGLPGAVELVIIFLVVLPALTLWTVGLSALGGYLGAYVRANSGSTRDRNGPSSTDADY